MGKKADCLHDRVGGLREEIDRARQLSQRRTLPGWRCRWDGGHYWHGCGRHKAWTTRGSMAAPAWETWMHREEEGVQPFGSWHQWALVVGGESLMGGRCQVAKKGGRCLIGGRLHEQRDGG